MNAGQKNSSLTRKKKAKRAKKQANKQTKAKQNKTKQNPKIPKRAVFVAFILNFIR